MINYRHLTIVAVVGLLAACAEVTPIDPTVRVSVSPSSVELAPGESHEFTASVTGAVSGAVTWSATCGEIVGTGTRITYVAPEVEEECVLTATSVAAPQASGTAFIDVRIEDPTVTVTVIPSSAELAPGESQDFTASVTGAVSDAVTWSATCGEIVGTGTQITYVAPEVEEECVLTATSVAAPQASGSATIEVRLSVVEVDSTIDSGESVVSIDLDPGETQWIRVNIPSAQRGADRRIVVEAHDDGGRRQLDLVLYEPDRVTPTASTSGTAFFRPGLDGIGDGFIATALSAFSLRPLASASNVDRSVSVEGFCFGPCIARRAPTSLTHVYARITNAGGTSEVVPFYAYTQPFIDEAAPENDTPQGAVSVSATESFRGAIEVLGDVDWVRFEEAGTVVVTQREGYDLNLRIELYDQTGTFVEAYGPDEPFVVIDGDRAAIGSDPQVQRASVYGYYDVEYQ